MGDSTVVLGNTRMQKTYLRGKINITDDKNSINTAIGEGALDNLKGKKLLYLFGYRSLFSFYLFPYFQHVLSNESTCWCYIHHVRRFLDGKSTFSGICITDFVFFDEKSTLWCY